MPQPTPTRALNKHRRQHHGTAPIEECGHCQRLWGICRGKETFTSREDAQAMADLINQRTEYAEAIHRYACPWGSKETPHWHIGHARTRTDIRRVRKAERRWRESVEATVRRVVHETIQEETA
jgi:hypothetical protein